LADSLQYRRRQESHYPTRNAPVRPWGGGLSLTLEDVATSNRKPITDKAPDEMDMRYMSERHRMKLRKVRLSLEMKDK
jgi:hypothetical protein